jgi:hypothetical protein
MLSLALITATAVACSQAMMMADTLSSGIAKQFPNKVS